ncbi:hypothetical protein DM558_09725 [Entomomonas moraniae]|uniref:Uncharacterized protein n=1 Tax=Entomomonas moraniae TaxID=2213226 RepID=A0A3S9XF23_9GAMM|nr:hypothetical protein [Entomomonas moraniae]AZS51037.1 hypothetical protein DM558_09725 [Entomomonas moraniae]
MIINEEINRYLNRLSEKRIKCGVIEKMMTYGFNSISINSIHDNVMVLLQKIKDFIAWSNQFDATIKEAALENQLEYLINLAESDLIPMSAFDWLKDERACYFVWLDIQIQMFTTPNNIVGQNIYNTLQLPKICSSNKERFNVIINFFDLWWTSKNNKIAYLDNIKSRVHESLGRDPFKGLNKKDIEQIEWYYKYIKSHLGKYYPFQNATEPAPLPTPNQLALAINPLTTEETYYLIYALYDTWSPYSLSDKAIFKNALSKAYSQRKFRKKQEGKKPLNTYLKKETKDKLEQLREHYRNATLHDTLDLIIREAYEQMQRDGQRK